MNKRQKKKASKITWIQVYRKDPITGKKIAIGAVSKDFRDFADRTFKKAFKNISKDIHKMLFEEDYDPGRIN